MRRICAKLFSPEYVPPSEILLHLGTLEKPTFLWRETISFLHPESPTDELDGWIRKVTHCDFARTVVGGI